MSPSRFRRTLTLSQLITWLGLVLFASLAVVDLGPTMADDLPTLYEYYTEGGVISGLDDIGTSFKLNGKEIRIFSGALHYFRVPQEYWRDRLRKYRAAGLNTVETYVPWNLHEYQDGVYDFGNGSSDFSSFLDIEKFIKLAQEEDLLVILRPGPYICAEWEFGGLPSWLLRYEGIQVRTSDETYIRLVRRYYEKLLAIAAPLHFTKGGPIISVQIENEYGNVYESGKPVDTDYLNTLKNIIVENGIPGLFFTSDTPTNGFHGALPDVLATANFQDGPIIQLTTLKEHQPNKPLMVTEYWTGWFDHWTEQHHTRTAEAFGQVLDEILDFDSSFNLYMMHGGTNWGFMNGANVNNGATDNSGFQPDTTSYDYDAPLSEAGQYTDKYTKLRELTEKYSTVQLKTPEMPENTTVISFPDISVQGELSLEDLISQSEHHIKSENLLSMELLDINNNSGQSYGYIVYRKTNLNIPANAVLTIEGRVCDTVLVLVNGELRSKILTSEFDLNEFGYWRTSDSTLNLKNSEEIQNATLDLVVENWGRVNYGKLSQFNQHKGLWQGNVLLNDNILSDWTIVPLEFKQTWTNSLTGWKDFSNSTGPRLYRANLYLTQGPFDTYIDMTGWTKGVVIVNNFVLARHFKLGPQLFAYLPAPLLKRGANDILIFEHFVPSSRVLFTNAPVFGNGNE